MLGIDDAIAGGEKLLSDVIDRVWPTPIDKATSQAIAVDAAAKAAVAKIKAELSLALAEAQSQDKWTSRARPSFLYVMYVLILACLPMGVVAAFRPALATAIAAGMQAWLAAIPGDLWTVFGSSFAVYAIARSADKAGGIAPLITGKK